MNDILVFFVLNLVFNFLTETSTFKRFRNYSMEVIWNSIRKLWQAKKSSTEELTTDKRLNKKPAKI